MTSKNPTGDREDALAVDSGSYASYRAYFEEFLPTIVGDLLLPDLRELSARVEIRVTNSGDEPWYLTLSDGVLIRVDHNQNNPECCFVLDTDTLLDVVSAQLSPQEAFFDMRIEIEGDMERGLLLSSVLEIFFKRFPHRRARTDTEFNKSGSAE